MINTNKKPFCLEGWEVKSHIKNGTIDLKNTELWLAPNQEDGIIGTELQKLVPNPLNANVLDYLLENPTLIPEKWKDKCIYFWGTIYRNSDGDLYVRCLYWSGYRWDWSYCWLDGNFYGVDPAAVLASPKSLDTKPSLENLNLEQAIKVCKDNGLRVYREL